MGELPLGMVPLQPAGQRADRTDLSFCDPAREERPEPAGVREPGRIIPGRSKDLVLDPLAVEVTERKPVQGEHLERAIRQRVGERARGSGIVVQRLRGRGREPQSESHGGRRAVERAANRRQYVVERVEDGRGLRGRQDVGAEGQPKLVVVSLDSHRDRSPY